MNFWLTALLILALLLSAFAVFFVIIARKGRQLRKSQPLPPPAKHAYLEWQEGGKGKRQEIEPPFYFGSLPENNIILRSAKQNFEVCIFYHNNRFAIQALDGAGPLLINGEETIAGYLWDGDLLEVADERFLFRSA